MQSVDLTVAWAPSNQVPWQQPARMPPSANLRSPRLLQKDFQVQIPDYTLAVGFVVSLCLLQMPSGYIKQDTFLHYQQRFMSDDLDQSLEENS